MRSMVMVSSLALVLLACTPPVPEPTPVTPLDAADGAPSAYVPPPPPPPSAPTDPATAACANMSLVGCSEGSNPLCAAELRKVQEAGAGFGDPQLKCLSIAGGKAAVRACGPFVACK